MICQLCSTPTELGEFAHIVARNSDGPRNKRSLVNSHEIPEDYDLSSECNCHNLIDRQPELYTYNVLSGLKTITLSERTGKIKPILVNSLNNNPLLLAHKIYECGIKLTMKKSKTKTKTKNHSDVQVKSQTNIGSLVKVSQHQQENENSKLLEDKKSIPKSREDISQKLPEDEKSTVSRNKSKTSQKSRTESENYINYEFPCEGKYINHPLNTYPIKLSIIKTNDTHKFECPICGKSFNRKSGFKNHVTKQVCIKNGRICPKCHQKFTRKENCTYHITHNVCDK